MLTMKVNRKTCSLQLQSYMAEFGPFYPWTVGGLMSYVAITSIAYIVCSYVIILLWWWQHCR